MTAKAAWRKEAREQRLFWLLVVLVGGVMLVGFVAPRYWRLRSLQAKVERLEERRHSVQEENNRVALTLEALETGRPEVWRLFVRDRLHYVERGFVPVLD